MSRLRITHRTTYSYTQTVAFGLHRLVVRPREGHDLLVESLDLEITPAHRVSWHRDVFGNSVGMVRFLENADQLEFCSKVVIQRRDHTSHASLMDLLPVTLPVQYDEHEQAGCSCYLAPVYPKEHGVIAEWLDREFSPKPGADAVELINSINGSLFRKMKYKRREDRGVQTPMETLELASGSCRDLATLLMEAARSLGLAARFASGYLHNTAATEGRASTHAWAEVYFPHHGWFGLDPTLGEGTSIKHIVTGVSSHPRGVMPVSGSFVGVKGCSTGMQVAVKIETLPGLSRDAEPVISEW